MDPYLWCWWHGFAQFCWGSPLTLKYAKQKVFTNYKQWEDLHTHDRACMCRFCAATTYSTSTQNDGKILYPHPLHAWPLFLTCARCCMEAWGSGEAVMSKMTARSTTPPRVTCGRCVAMQHVGQVHWFYPPCIICALSAHCTLHGKE